MATQIIKYTLFWMGREGFSPYEQAKHLGVDFRGGNYSKRGFMLGYLDGETEDIETAIAGMTAFAVSKLTENEAADFISSVVGSGFTDDNGVYHAYGTPYFDADKKEMVLPIQE